MFAGVTSRQQVVFRFPDSLCFVSTQHQNHKNFKNILHEIRFLFEIRWKCGKTSGGLTRHSILLKIKRLNPSDFAEQSHYGDSPHKSFTVVYQGS